MSISVILFFVLGAIAIASAIVTITHKHPVVAAMSLVVHFFMLAGLYLTLQAQFIAVLQILVYAGAIMVLVIFVIMLLNLGNEEGLVERFNFRKILAVLFATILAAHLFIVYVGNPVMNKALPESSGYMSRVQNLGNELFTNYIVPVEAIALLLMTAIFGAVILAKRNLD